MFIKLKLNFRRLLSITILSLLLISCGSKAPVSDQQESAMNQVEATRPVNKKPSIVGYEDVSYDDIERAPIYPACESFKTNLELKRCLSKNIQEYVQTNFDTDIAKRNNIHGSVEFVIEFLINEDGSITNITSDNANSKLVEEGIRVVSSLPKMTPARYDGKNVGVKYSLPLMFWFK